MTVASNFLTGKTDTVNCTTGTAEPGTFVGNMKSKLNLSFKDASKEAEVDEAGLAVCRSVRIAAELFCATN